MKMTKSKIQRSLSKISKNSNTDKIKLMEASSKTSYSRAYYLDKSGQCFSIILILILLSN